MKEALEIVYSQVVSMSQITVEVQKNRKRKLRSIEEIYKKYCSYKTCNKNTYNILIENPNVIVTFLERRRLLKLVMGDECVNFLLPSTFKCHVPNCEKIITLKSFNNLSGIMHHIKGHTMSNSAHPDESCNIMLLRYSCPCEPDFRNQYDMLSVTDAINKLETIKNGAGIELSIRPKLAGKMFLKSGTIYQGAHLEVDITILQNILKGEEEPLASLSWENNITSYFRAR